MDNMCGAISRTTVGAGFTTRKGSIAFITIDAGQMVRRAMAVSLKDLLSGKLL